MEDDPTLEQIAEALSWTYKPEGVDIILANRADDLDTPEGRRRVYASALAAAEGVFT